MGVGVGAGAGAGAGIFPEPEKSKVTGSGNPGLKHAVRAALLPLLMLEYLYLALKKIPELSLVGGSPPGEGGQ